MRSGREGARKERKKKLVNPSRGLPRLVSKLQSDLRQKYFAVPQAWEQTSEQAIERVSVAVRASERVGAAVRASEVSSAEQVNE